MTDFSNSELLRIAASPRFTALSQLGVSIHDVVNWDSELLREPRLLVPVDVNALVVGANGENMVRLGFRDADGEAPVVDDVGTPREPGVHLLWTVPAAFGRGTVVADPAAPNDRTRQTLQLKPLPDRWVVLRLAVAVGGTTPLVRGWVIEADNATVTPLADWPNSTVNTVSLGVPVAAEKLNVHVGGPGWVECYDAALGRLALHDPLDDLASSAPNGVVGDSITYVVAGWWSKVRHDPLDGVGSIFGYHDILREMGWDDPDHPEQEGRRAASERSSTRLARTFNLQSKQRYTKTSANQASYYPSKSSFAHAADHVASIFDAPTRATLLHGRIHGVPLRTITGPDDRPAAASVRAAFGPTSPSVAALLASGALVAPTNVAEQRNAERLLTAFNSGLLSRIGEPDVWPEIDHYEHVQGFGARPGGIEAVDRFRDSKPGGNDPGSDSRPGRRGALQYAQLAISANMLWSVEKYTASAAVGSKAPGTRGVPIAKSSMSAKVAAAVATGATRAVERPALPFNYPVAPVLAVTGAGRRIRAAERDEADGSLRVRTADQPDRGSPDLVAAADLLPSIGSGAVPEEVLDLAREAVAADPYLADWRVSRVAGTPEFVAAAGKRLRSEAVVNYAYYVGSNATLQRLTGASVTTTADRQVAVEGLLKHASIAGVWAHPEGVTMWGQPWRPQFCEWTAELHLADLAALTDSNGWQLGEFELDRAVPFSGGESVTITGRSPLQTNTARSLAEAVARWLQEERDRDDEHHGLASPEVERAMAGLQGHLGALDVLSVTLDGVREQLLGLRYDRGLVHADEQAGVDGVARAFAVALPRLVSAGRLRLTAARLVDSFGRLLPIAIDTAAVVARSADAGQPGATLQLRPRLQTPARLHLRLVDPLSTDDTAGTALVDQVDPKLQVNPVAGFMLPDHIDEALELFGPDGTPLGQVSHDAFSDAVFWEGAPGRVDIGPAAGPLDDPEPDHRRLGWIAAGLVAADAASRQATPARPESESPLSALLRAVDTTLWSVDPFGSLGQEHIVGLVGRPIAVVTAHLTLDVPDDADTLAYPGADGDAIAAAQEARRQAFADLADTNRARRHIGFQLCDRLLRPPGSDAGKIHASQNAHTVAHRG